MGFIAKNKDALLKVGGAFFLFQMAGQSLKARQEREAMRQALEVRLPDLSLLLIYA